MSKFVKINTTLREPALIRQALDDLEIRYREDAVYRHPFSRHTQPVTFLVEDARCIFGLAPDQEGAFQVLGDDMQTRRIQEVMAPLRQRYAYHKVVAETSVAGFDLVEETVGQDNVIRLTVRRWS